MSRRLTVQRPFGVRRGFTLLEVLIALTITLILMTLVVRVFQITSDGVFNSRANMEMSDQLRNAKHRLIQDLRGTTALTIPPAQPTWCVGYFEYHEGDLVAVSAGGDVGFRPTGTMGTLGSSTPIVFTEYGDRDDILLFTTANYEGDFVGRLLINGQPRGMRSKYAEVAWYPHVIEDAANANQQLLTLRRRQWLITNAAANTSTLFDSTARNMWGQSASTQWQRPTPPITLTNATYTGFTVANTLESLTKRENRQYHGNPGNTTYTGGWAYPATNHPLATSRRGITVGAYPVAPFDFTSLSLQTVSEQASSGVDKGEHNMITAASRTFREAEDIILSNIVGFDVKAWDPGAPVFRVVADKDFPELVGCVVPGDPGYLLALNRFMITPTSDIHRPVSFGAYADLNYMGYLASQSPYSFGITATNFPLTKYRSALATMNANGGLPMPSFAGPGDLTSKLAAVRDGTWLWSPATYDTFSRHYEYDGVSQITPTTGGLNIVPISKRLNHYTGELLCDPGMNGVDDNGNGLVDEPYERDAVAPYEKPLRGIRVSIRAIEPDSKNVRQVTVVHEFIPL
jgi:prepilin-type N-terminal cleavage/methylation domain-containing protein